MASNITVIIHTHNEEKNIEECIESTKLLTSQILVVDMESQDSTLTKVQQMNIPVVHFPFSHYVEPARTFGIENAQTEWVFILDADERMTAELSEEVKTVVSNQSSVVSPNLELITYYRVPRKNIFGRKQWLSHGGWWPDQQIRMINRKYFKSWSKEIHSTPEIEGNMGYLQNHIIHYFHGDLEQMVEKTVTYENIESELLFKANRHVSTTTFFRKFFGELFRRLIKNGGFMDGPIGIIESLYQAFSKTITYLYLYEKKSSSL